MPIYDYECKVCGEKREVLQKADEPAPDCTHQPEMDSDDAVVPHGPMERVMSVPSRAQFKGSGFYETDYKRRGK